MAKGKKPPAKHLELFTEAVGALTPLAASGYVARDVTSAPVRPTRAAAFRDWLAAHGMDD
jgi:hypothetical protein